MKPVTILIANRNGREATKLCIESIRTRTNYAPGYSILVYDSPGDGQDREYLKAYRQAGDIKLIEGSEDLSHGEAVRLLIEKCVTDWAVILDSDTEIISSDWLTSLADRMVDDGTILAVAHRRPCIESNYGGGELISATFWLACMLLNVQLYRPIADPRDFPHAPFLIDEYPWRNQFTPKQMELGKRKFGTESGGWFAERIIHGEIPFRINETPPALWSRQIIHYSGISRNWNRPEHPLVAPLLTQIHRRLAELRNQCSQSLR